MQYHLVTITEIAEEVDISIFSENIIVSGFGYEQTGGKIHTEVSEGGAKASLF